MKMHFTVQGVLIKKQERIMEKFRLQGDKIVDNFQVELKYGRLQKQEFCVPLAMPNEI